MKFYRLPIALLLIASASTFVGAAEKQATAMPNEAMLKAMKMGTPGSNHEALTPLVGKWTCTVRGWMAPGEKPQESQGTSENTLVLGGRFLRQEFRGNWAGQPFEGVGYTGFDNLRGEYESIWMDNMSTGMMQSTGSYDSAAKTIRTSGTFSCPLTNERQRWLRSETKIIDNDNNVYTSYFKGADGKEFKSMEITYKRAK